MASLLTSYIFELDQKPLKWIVLVIVYIVIQHSNGHMMQTNSERSVAAFKFELSHLFFIADEMVKQNCY